MLAVIDPVLLDAQAPIPAATLADLLRLLRNENMRIPGGKSRQGPLALPTVYETYLRRRVQHLSQAKAGDTTEEAAYRKALRGLESFLTPVYLAPLPAAPVVHGAERLFIEPWLTPEECRTLTALVAHCAASGEPTILFTRLIDQRNVLLRVHKHMTYHEKLVWRLEVRIDGAAPVFVPCLCSSRNRAVPWTCRYDDELPAEEDSAEFPFCPHLDWESDPALPVLVSHTPGYGWQDLRGNRWKRPDTPGKGDHWDLVFGGHQLRDEYGDAYLNIVRWGLPPGTKTAGSIDHVQSRRRQNLKKQTGWRCK